MEYKGFATKAVHCGQEPEQRTGAVVVPLYQTSTFAQDAIGQHRGYEYARTNNPTREAWEKNLAALEGGIRGFAFASGMAAVDTVLRLLTSGDHVIAAIDMYGGTFRLFDKVLRHFGMEFTYVDMTDINAIKAACKENTKMIYTETPTNPMMMLTDIAAVAAIAKEQNALLVVDNTFATPYLQQPLALGADIVLHSATKYLGGHSDLVSGAVVVKSAEIGDKLGFLQNAAGAVCAPFEAWLLLRSAKTLALRMEQHASTAQKIAEFCEQHPSVKKVFYPGLTSHPQYELCKRQMRHAGGMISVELGSLEQAKKFTEALNIFTLAESLGGVESLVCHPVSMTHGSVPEETRLKLGITPGLVRLSCGVEDAEDLMADIESALRAI